jgi:hypothetical protein
MRSALSLSLVLLATMCGQAASASEYSAQPLRLLLTAYASQQVEVGSTDSFGFTCDQPALSAGELRVSTPADASVEPCSEPASRSYESALVGGLPLRGP